MRQIHHPKKEIGNALAYMARNGWRIEQGGSHAWGQAYCPFKTLECRHGEFCRVSVWSTPKRAESHARALRRVVDSCVVLRMLKEADEGCDD